MKAETVQIIQTALEDYRKWFCESDANDAAMLESIDRALDEIVQESQHGPSFPIAWLHRDDLENHKDDNPHFLKDTNPHAITDAQLEAIANRLGEDYLEQLFWDHLGSVAESVLAR